MAFALHYEPDDPVIVLQLTERYDPASELEFLSSRLLTLLRKCDEPIVLVADLREFHPSLEHLLDSVNHAVSTEGFLNHPMLLSTLVVTTNQMLLLAVEGLSTPVFGSISITACATLDEALDRARVMTSTSMRASA